MKRFIALAVGTLVLAQPSFARRGGGDNNGITRGSAAWFLSESAEDSVEWLVSSGATLNSELSSIAVNLDSPTAATVTLTTASGQLNETCSMIEESLRGGTVIKKDTRCGGRMDSELPDLVDGSAAWLAVESIEHSVRQAVATTPSVLSQLTGVTSTIQANANAVVGLELADGSTLNFTCAKVSRRAANWSLRCSLIQIK